MPIRPPTERSTDTATRYDPRHRPNRADRLARAADRECRLRERSRQPAHRQPKLSGDVAITRDANGNATNGLTTQWLYCDDLSNGTSGLTSSAGAGYTSVKTGAANSVSILSLIVAPTKRSLPRACRRYPSIPAGHRRHRRQRGGRGQSAGRDFGDRRDALGRPVISGIIKPDGTPVTWQTAYYAPQADATGVAAGLLQTVQIDALGHATVAWSDAAGRTRQIADALGKIASVMFDPNGNMVPLRDPNNVGWDAGTALNTYDGYDVRNRLTDRTDTQNDKTKTVYDQNGNVVQTFDAKNYVSQAVSTKLAYDARDRKVSMTDRNGGVTTWGYDPNGNLLTLCDPDNQARVRPRRPSRPSGPMTRET